MVSKSEGAFRPLGDHRQLNNITKKNCYSIPIINLLITKLHRKKIFSKTDLSPAYHQIPVHPNHVCMIAILMKQGLLEYNYVPFTPAHWSSG